MMTVAREEAPANFVPAAAVIRRGRALFGITGRKGRAGSLRVSNAIPRLSPGLSHLTSKAACAPFTPSNSEQRSPPSYYRGCWHEVSRGFFSRYRHHRRGRKSFTTRRPSSLTRHCWIRVAPIVQYSPLLPPVGVWAVSQSQCG